IQRSSHMDTSPREAEHPVDKIHAIIQQALSEGEGSASPVFQAQRSVFPEGNMMASSDLSRRSLLQQLLGLTSLTTAFSQQGNPLAPLLSIPTSVRSLDAPALNMLHNLIEACWQLCNVGQMRLVEHVLAAVLPELVERAAFQRQAAQLTAHGLRLKSLLEAHQLRLAQMIPLCLQSVAYAQAANDPDSLSAALNGLAVAYKYNRQFHRSFEAYEAALLASEQATPLLRSRVSAGAAAAFATRGFKQEALRLIGLAYEQFPEHPEQNPFFYSADNGLFMLIYYEGLVYLALGEPEKALQAFEKSKELAVPERNRLEMVNHWGRAAILAGDLDLYTFCLEEGVRGAIALQSQKRLDEAIEIFQEQVPRSWQAESSLRQVAEKCALPFTAA
ncbi:MAG TPA: hypothetical protein VFV38_50170, partial [Ktedonobacteraceae bacterium]|nr:hypothetical protein [Ktedonobacteraceae bacterium]